MQNQIQAGKNLTLTAPSALVAGQAVLIGAIFCVANGAAASGAQFVGVLEGVFELPRAATLTVAEGAKLYWDNTAKLVTTVVGSNTLIGACVVASVTADTTIAAYLDGVIR